MNTPFILNDLCDSTWAVSWPSFDEKFTTHMKFNMLNCIFKEIKCHEVGLGISLDEKEEPSILWIEDKVWFSDLSEEYSQYLYKYYNIRGAVFHKQQEAEQFKDILEKRYIWQILQE